MRVRISYDEGLTWPIQRMLDVDRGGYSSLTKTADLMVGSLQEIGADALGRHSIIFRKFNLPWILNGTPEPVPPPGTGAPDILSDADETLRVHPSPFVSETTIRFQLDRDADVDLRVVDAAGRLVELLREDRLARGTHRIAWRGDVAPGVYFVRLDVEGAVQTRKIVRAVAEGVR